MSEIRQCAQVSFPSQHQGEKPVPEDGGGKGGREGETEEPGRMEPVLKVTSLWEMGFQMILI